MKLDLSFISSEIIASFSCDISLLPVMAIAVPVVVKVVLLIKKKRI